MLVTMSLSRTTLSCSVTLVVVVTLSLLCTCLAPALAQTNNTVNETTREIHWGQLAPDRPYKTAGYTADDGGLDPYYALATSFIDSSLPELLPVDKVEGIINGEKSIQDEWQDLATDFVGFAVCVVIGILFIIIFPIVGCCFCCCRCCGNCGGKRLQKPEDNSKCKRTGFSIALAILSLFVITGAVCTFVTSDQVSKNLKGLNSSFSDSIDDFNTYLDNIDSQFRRIGETNFNFMKDVLVDYVANASSEVSERIVDDINRVVGMADQLNQLSALSGTALTKVQELEDKVTRLESQRGEAIRDLAVINGTAPCNGCLDLRIAVLENMDFTQLRNNISAFKTKVSTDVFGKMRDDIDKAIKSEVDKGTQNLDVAAKMDEIYNNNIKSLLDEIDTLKGTLNNDASTYQDRVGEYSQTAEPYDQYRWYAGLGLAIFLLLIGLLMLVGVVLGFCCGSYDTRPTERGTASNCGGICLMSAVGLIFIFGALLMLLTTLMYIFGSLSERYMCQSVDHLDRIEKYTSSFDLGFDLSNITFDFNGEVVKTSASRLMSDCKEDKTLYTALNLKGPVDSALQKIKDYKNNLNITDDIDTSQAAQALNGTNVDNELKALDETVDAIADVQGTIGGIKTILTSEKADAKTNASNTEAGQAYDPMLATLGDMEAITVDLNATSRQIQDIAGQLPAKINQATAKLNDTTFMNGVIRNTTQAFVDTIFGFVDSYTNDIQEKLQRDVGKCSPVYSITNAIFAEAFCHGIVDPLNGFWLALGWCLFFFIPSLILAVKLAKYFRVMKFEDTYDSTMDPVDAKPPPYYTEPSAPPAKTSIFPPINGPNNKVAPF